MELPKDLDGCAVQDVFWLATREKWPSPLYLSLHLDRPKIRASITQHPNRCYYAESEYRCLEQRPRFWRHQISLLRAFDELVTPFDHQSVADRSKPHLCRTPRHPPPETDVRATFTMRNQQASEYERRATASRRRAGPRSRCSRSVGLPPFTFTLCPHGTKKAKVKLASFAFFAASREICNRLT